MTSYFFNLIYINSCYGKLANKDIIEFAQHNGIHLGIVVGRLQHDGNLAQNKGSKLKKV